MIVKPHDLQKDGKLSLKNDGALELFFIGVGSALAMTNNQTNFLIVKGNTHLMVDFGVTGPRALLQTSGLNPIDLKNFFCSHLHGDHCYGLEDVAIRNRYITQKQGDLKLRMIITKELQHQLWDHTLSGSLAHNEDPSEQQQYLAFSDYFDSIRPKWKLEQPREIFELEFSDLHLEIFRTKHVPDIAKNWEDSFLSYGMFIDQRIFVSIDTRTDLELIDLYADRSEVMFHDCQLFGPESVHATLDDLSKLLPMRVKKKMFLMHYGDNWRDHEARVAREQFLGFAKQGVRYIFD